MYKVRNARNSLCSSTQFRLLTADAAKVAQLSETEQGYSLWSQELQFTFVNCLQITHKFKHEHEKEYSLHVIGAVRRTTDDVVHCIGDTVTNNKADAKSPPPVIFTASRRQSFSCPKSTSSRQSVIFFTSQSHFFM